MTEPTVAPVEDMPFPPARCPFEAPAEYTRLREEEPIAKVRLPYGGEAWLVTKHEYARAILADRSFSSDRTHPNFPMTVIARRSLAQQRRSLIAMDGQEHTDERRSVIGEFTVKRMQALRPRIQAIVDGFIDDMLAAEKPVDLVAALSLPVPSLVICELLGVPYADHDFFQARTVKLIRRSTSDDDRFVAIQELREYLGDLVDRKEREPGDDLLSRQIRARKESGTFERDVMVSLATLLLIAGHETTANMISLGTLALLENPEQAAAIKDDPSRTPIAVEEMLRYFSIVESATSRIATRDVEIGGVTIKADEGVIVSGLAANWDGGVFDNPESLDFERGARHHVAFGFGPHQCLGQNLARMELQIVFDTLFRRIPGLRLAVSVDELPFKDDASIYGIYEMPVTW